MDNHRHDIKSKYGSHNLVDFDRGSLNTLSSSTVTGNSHLKIFKPTSLCPARCYFILIRSINARNFLSDEIRAAQPISRFKRNLISHDLSKFINCC